MKKFTYWVLKIIPAVIMLQTLYFKFTAHPQSVHLFTILGLEPYGRVGIGVAELIAVILLLIPSTTILGAIMGMGLMAGAIFSHITKLGIVFDGDALLFTYAVITFVCCAIIVYMHKHQIPGLLKFKLT
jgi:DoxX-like family